ncbi:MAG TPA: tetratricopeptide repeat protein [Gemmataceae bacterium]|nr:tetratricopeptide repeat protein [Gemmataceae bacterium]
MANETIESLCQKARQAVAQGDNDQARQIYVQALALKADAPDVHYGLATVCFLVNDLQSAAHHFREVTRLDPLRAGAHINLGAVYNRLDKVDEAIQVLRRGIQLDTRRAEGYYNLGLAYRRKRQLDLAIQAYHEATRLNPRMADAHLNLANAYLDKGQYHLAVSHYHQALELRPNWEKAENGLAQAEAAMASARRPATPVSSAAGDTVSDRGNQAVSTATAILDPERTIDPNLHGAQLSYLHHATIESENQGRNFVAVLEKELEPALKELSSCLFYPDGSMGGLDTCLQKFENAIHSLRSAQRSLQSCLDQVRTLGDQLIKST